MRGFFQGDTPRHCRYYKGQAATRICESRLLCA
nr:MAG TPA: hypothetical protein [Caudoviricetes sp.]